MGNMPSSSAPVGEGSPRLIYSWGMTFPEALCYLRVFTGARVIIGYTNAKVAGAISQTNMLDYRQVQHFGPPLSSVEVKLMEVSGRDIDGGEPQGKLLVTGPAVVGGQTTVEGQIMKVTESGTLAYGEALPDRRDDLGERMREIEQATAERIG